MEFATLCILFIIGVAQHYWHFSDEMHE